MILQHNDDDIIKLISVSIKTYFTLFFLARFVKQFKNEFDEAGFFNRVSK